MGVLREIVLAVLLVRSQTAACTRAGPAIVVEVSAAKGSATLRAHVSELACFCVRSVERSASRSAS